MYITGCKYMLNVSVLHSLCFPYSYNYTGNMHTVSLISVHMEMAKSSGALFEAITLDIDYYGEGTI